MQVTALAYIVVYSSIHIWAGKCSTLNLKKIIYTSWKSQTIDNTTSTPLHTWILRRWITVSARMVHFLPVTYAVHVSIPSRKCRAYISYSMSYLKATVRILIVSLYVVIGIYAISFTATAICLVGSSLPVSSCRNATTGQIIYLTIKKI